MPTSKEEIENVVEELEYGLPEMRKAAAIKLGRIRDERVIQPLIRAMQHDEYSWTRISALQSLAWIADPSIIEPISQVAKTDKSALVRKIAVEILSSMDHENIITILNQIFKTDSDPDVKAAAMTGIKVKQKIS